MKKKIYILLTPTGNMSKGALPIAFVNTTPQIVNDIFNKIEGSSNNQLTTKVMDIKDFIIYLILMSLYLNFIIYLKLILLLLQFLLKQIVLVVTLVVRVLR